jgi:hypothetical protein
MHYSGIIIGKAIGQMKPLLWEVEHSSCSSWFSQLHIPSIREGIQHQTAIWNIAWLDYYNIVHVLYIYSSCERRKAERIVFDFYASLQEPNFEIVSDVF